MELSKTVLSLICRGRKAALYFYGRKENKYFNQTSLEAGPLEAGAHELAVVSALIRRGIWYRAVLSSMVASRHILLFKLINLKSSSLVTLVTLQVLNALCG